MIDIQVVNLPTTDSQHQHMACWQLDCQRGLQCVGAIKEKTKVNMKFNIKVKKKKKKL